MISDENRKEKIRLHESKVTLRLLNFVVGIICAVAIFATYSQTFISMSVAYTLGAETLSVALSELGDIEVSEDDLSSVEGTEISVSLSLEGSDLSVLLVDELNAVVSGNDLIETCEDNELLGNTVSSVVDTVVPQMRRVLARVVAIYAIAIVGDTASAITDTAESGGYVLYAETSVDSETSSKISELLANDSLTDDLAAVIEDLVAEGSISSDELKETINSYLTEHQDELDITDEELEEICAQVEDVVDQLVEGYGDESGTIDTDSLAIQMMISAGLITEDSVSEDATIDDVLYDFIMDLLEEYDVVCLALVIISFIVGVLYLLWGWLLLKSIVHIISGTPMWMFTAKIFTGIPYIIILLLKLVTSDLVMPLIVEMLADLVAFDLSAIALGFGGGFVAAICTLVLYLLGFIYNHYRKAYRESKHILNRKN